jgi:hypothetical protein
MTAINLTISTGVKNRINAIQTDRHVTQSKGFNLFPQGYLSFFFIQDGIPAMLTK